MITVLFQPQNKPCLIPFLFIALLSFTAPVEGFAFPQDGDATGETSAEELPASDTVADEDAQPQGKSLVDTVTEAIAPVDKWFGKYLVSPMANFFFYDFGTGPEFDDDGKLVSEGWLGVSVPFVVVWLLVGAIYLTIRMAFINLRGFFHAINLTRGAYDNPDDDQDEGEVSHFQALSSALSATVGLGNIAGVAIAIGTGGPGATFWMILIGLLGMSSKFTECTLGQMYRRVDPETGRVSGGPMRYLKEGLTDLGLKPLGMILAFVFSLLCIGASLGGGNAFQVGQSLDAIREDIPFIDQNPWIYGLILSIGVGAVIIGGIKAIGKVASRIVPFMCLAYVLMALYIIFTNLDLVGPAFSSIFANAFNAQAGIGAVLGVMVIGIQRAAFSNEAGVGSAAIAHSAAKTNEPVSEGIVALLEPFIDTVVICTMTALVIIIAGGDWVPQTEAGNILTSDYGSWTNPDYGLYVSGENKSGAALTRSAISGDHGLPWFKYVLYVAVIMFAYSTLISWYYYGERCWTTLFGEWSSFAFKLLFLVFTVLGSIVTTGNILAFSDLLILSMALPNILGLFLLSGKVKEKLDDYWARKKSGEIKKYK